MGQPLMISQMPAAEVKTIAKKIRMFWIESRRHFAANAAVRAHQTKRVFNASLKSYRLPYYHYVFLSPFQWYHTRSS